MDNRIKGCLFGIAVGDMLGLTNALKDKEHLSYERTSLIHELFPFGKGEISDDTQMTIALAEGILENMDNPIFSIGTKFLEWRETNPKDVGMIVDFTIHFHLEGQDWFTAAKSTHEALEQKSAGNGSLMRCLPVALLYQAESQLEKWTILQSKMTHFDDLCSEACLLCNQIAFSILRGDSLKESIKRIISGTRYEHILTKNPSCEQDGYVVNTFSWVLYFLLNTETFVEAVQAASSVNGDSDTIGSITGGLAGLFYVFNQIPDSYSKELSITNELIELSDRIVKVRLS